jgi:ribose transport system ATP-binding protein
LVGSGRTEALRTLFGLDVRRGGWAQLGNTRIERFSTSDWTSRGVGILSEDRKAEGLALQLSCLTNITLSAVPRRQAGWIDFASEREAAQAVARRLRIKWGDPADKVQSLSGGNQQKVAMGRLLHSDADVLLLDEPTRGIDVGAKVDLYLAIGELAQRGKAIVLVSSYLPELFGVCDRIAVMCRGTLSPAYDTSNLTPERVMHMAIGDAGLNRVEGTAA